MKKMIITCSLILAASAVSFGQNSNTQQGTPAPSPSMNAQAPANRTGAPTSEQAAEQRAKMYQTQLNLNPEQYKAVYAAELDFINGMTAARAGGTRPTDGQVSQLMQGKDQKFKNALTAEQYEKYSQYKTSPYARPGGATAPAGH